MAMIEIDETELANYRQLADVANKALRHPKARSLYIDALAEVNDQVANAPDRLIRKEIDERLGGITEKLDGFMAEFKTEREKEKESAQIRELEANLKAGREIARSRGYTGDGLKVIEEFKADHGILDYEDAIAAYERRNPPPTPISTGSARWDFLSVPEEEAADLKPLMEGNDETFLHNEIGRTLRNIRSG